jgi:hypothetical protein
MHLDTAALETGILLLVAGAIITATVAGYVKRNNRAKDLEMRAVVDKAVAIAEQRAEDAITGAVNSLRKELHTGNGATLGEYVKHLGDEMTEMRTEVRAVAGTVGDIDDRLTDLEISQRKHP